MAQFTPKKLDKNAINGGNRFNKGDGFSEAVFNDPIEAILYLQENGGSGGSVDQALVDQVNANTQEIGHLQSDSSRQEHEIINHTDKIYLLEEKDKAILANTDGILDEAIKKGITESTKTLTDEEKTSVCEWLGAVGKTDYATGDVAGIVRVRQDRGIAIIGAGASQGLIELVPAREDEKVKELTNRAWYKPITAGILDKAIAVGISTNTITLSEEEKTSALAWLGVNNLPDLLTLTEEQKDKWKSWLQSILS